MRIAYVSLHWARTRNNGVGKKIRSQIAAWNALGHESRLFMHAEQYRPVTDLIEADYFFYLHDGKIRTEFSRISAMSEMVDAIRSFQPDIIYLRYGIYVYPVHRLMDIAPIVEEINTNDLSQHDGLGGIYSLYNRMTRGILLRLVHGLVTVSNELAVSPAFASYHKPTRIIANGVDLNGFPLLPAPANKRPSLVFIGNPGYIWHGVDKIVALARMFPDLHMDIIGYDQLPGCGPLPGNLSLHGYLGLDAYQRVLCGADVAISSLALHRVGLHEASPLKSRECLAFGLPLILAYKDTDLDGLDLDFLLQIPNTEDNIQTHAKAIYDFAYQMRGRRADRRLLMQMDQGMKETQRVDFFKEIIRAWRGEDKNAAK